MPFLNVKNRAESTLAAGISDSDLSLTLDTGDGTKFPVTNFHITIEDEILLCSSRTGDVCTVVREQEETTAAAHAAGKAVELRITARIIEELQNAPPSGFTSRARAYLTTPNQVIPGDTETKVRLDGEDFDGDGEFDSTTNYRFIANNAGYYLVTAQVFWSMEASDWPAEIKILKNGASEILCPSSQKANEQEVRPLSAVVYLDADDYLELWVYEPTGTDRTIDYGRFKTFMSIHRLS